MLNDKTIEIGERKITITEATAYTGAKKDLAIQEAIKKDNEDKAAELLELIYIPLASCSSGDVPTLDEFKDMREAESVAWMEAATDINPHWFGIETPIEKKEK